MDTRGAGWVLFAAIVLGVAGIMRIFDAIWAFRYHGVLPADLEGAIFGHSLKTYGWVYLVVAIVLILCAFLVMARSQLGRWVGIIAAAIACISAIWWMPFYPIWSLTYIALGALVIYALAAYGGKPEAV
jgi:Ca2+/Na+ antiporter